MPRKGSSSRSLDRPPDTRKSLTDTNTHEGQRRGRQGRRWLEGITDVTDMRVSKLSELVMGRLACCSPWGHKESDTTERLNSNNTDTPNTHTQALTQKAHLNTGTTTRSRVHTHTHTQSQSLSLPGILCPTWGAETTSRGPGGHAEMPSLGVSRWRAAALGPPSSLEDDDTVLCPHPQTG